MERVIGGARGGAARVEVLEGFSAAGDLRDLVAGRVAGRTRGGLGLEQAPERTQVVDRLLLQERGEDLGVERVLALDPDHRRASPGPHLDEAEGHERLNRLPDRVRPTPYSAMSIFSVGRRSPGPNWPERIRSRTAALTAWLSVCRASCISVEECYFSSALSYCSDEPKSPSCQLRLACAARR